MKSYNDWVGEKIIAKLKDKEIHLFSEGKFKYYNGRIYERDVLFSIDDFFPQARERILKEMINGDCNNCCAAVHILSGGRIKAVWRINEMIF